MKKLLFIFNPHSGTGEICKHLGEVLDVFTKAHKALRIALPKEG